MDGEFFQAIMAETNAANQADGMDFRGKKYLTVAKRVEIARRNFGGSIGITTDPVQIGTVKGEPIIFKATITDDKGFVLATGHSWEVIGVGHVNATSALENAETSAVGRALAALGIHGGEYASANELRDKPENPTVKALSDAWEDAIADKLPDDPSAELLADAYADQIEADLAGYKTVRGLDGYKAKHDHHIRFIEEHAPERYGPLKALYLGLRKELTEGKAA
jgi:hypothetical protein